MEKVICYCDRCGEEIGNVKIYCLARANGETAKAIVESVDVKGYVDEKYLKPLEFDSVQVILFYDHNEKKYDLCEKCIKKLKEFIERKEN